MKFISRCLLIVACWFSGQAIAQNTTMLCSPPQQPDCVWPQWGSIEPDDPTGLVGPSSAIASKAGVSHVRVAMVASAGRTVAPKIVVDDGKKYARETTSLVSALKAARFDAEGKLISGEERISAALERVNKVSPNHQLVLYLKASPKLKGRDRKLLAAKVQQLNEILERGTAAK